MEKGTTPTLLGTIVTGAGITMMTMKKAPKLSAGIVGFGLAHIVLGSLDMIKHK